LRKNDFQTQIGTVGIFLGGRSRERSISLRSGRAVYQALQDAGFRVSKIDTANGFRKTLGQRNIDFAFPALHGAGGEDGQIQALLNRYQIPYAGSDPKASALAFNKLRAKQQFEAVGVPTPAYAVLKRQNWKQTLKRWDPPYVLKPIEEGSSIDVHVVTDAAQGERKVASLMKRYRQFLIEKAISGREFTVAILGGEALPVIEIITKRPFYDFKAKYTKGFTNYLVPAPISKAFSKTLRTIALQANSALGLLDFSRVDFMVDQDMMPFVLEVNSIPGFTETSLLPKAAQSVGLDFSQLCTRILKLAYERQNMKSRS